MKKSVKIVVFAVTCITIMIVFSSMKQSLKASGQPAAIMWIGVAIIMVLYYIMFGSFGKIQSKQKDKNDDIQLRK